MYVTWFSASVCTAAFSKQMRDPVDGLYAHGVNVATSPVVRSCCKWGRANGWGMLSHIEVLSALAVSMVNCDLQVSDAFSVSCRQHP